MRITVLDGYGLNPGDLSWSGFESLGELQVYPRTAASEVVDRAKDSEILITNKTILDAGIIRQLPQLKYIGVLATGYNVVDVEEAHKRGVTVTNIPAYSTMSVAQHVFALLLAVTDRVEYYAAEVRSGRWSRNMDFCFWDTPFTELAGKKFGIIGLGNIGSAVARIALAFGMEVLVSTSKDATGLLPGIKKLPLKELYSESDIISLHCPLTPTTKEMINRTTIGDMKRGVILINTGRGPLVDEEAVAEALGSGKIGAYCADVLTTEPPSAENPLQGLPGAYVTPHIAWATKEARLRLMDIAEGNLRSFLAGRPINTV